MLSDHRIKQAIRTGLLSIDAFNDDHLQAASYDVHLHPQILVLNDALPGVLDPKVDTTDQWVQIEIPEDGYTIGFGRFILGSTLQQIAIGRKLIGQLEGRSSLGRLGLMVHSTAGYVDPGFQGQVTLELSCVHPRGIRLYPGMPIGQLAFDDCLGVEQLYEGKYQHQRGPTPSLYHQNWLGDGWK